MKAETVLLFLQKVRARGLDVCIDGGWAVDALLGEQTRQHDDLDIALPAAQAQALRAMLADDGYAEVRRTDSWEHNFVLAAPSGDIVDVHTYELHPDGSNRRYAQKLLTPDQAAA